MGRDIMKKNVEIDLEEYYKDINEDNRLVKDKAHSIEFLTTIRYIEKYLQKEDRILEIGAATGRYSIYFARKGYRVDSVELLKENLEILTSKIADNMNINATQGNALDLGMYEDNTFEITLLLGPLYHLFSEDEKKKAIEEAIRVTKKNGKIFIAYITNETAILSYCLRKGNMSELKKICDENYKVRRVVDKVFSVNYVWDIEKIMQSFNVIKLKQVATDGISPQLSLYVNKLNDKDFNTWLEYHFKTCEREDLLSYSSHILYICEKNYTTKIFDYEKYAAKIKKSNFNFEQWQEKYYDNKFIKLKEELEKEDIELLNKLGINVQDDLYTEYEYDILLEQKILPFYIDNEMSEVELELVKPLPKNVSRVEYQKLLDKFEIISQKYKL